MSNYLESLNDLIANDLPRLKSPLELASDMNFDETDIQALLLGVLNAILHDAKNIEQKDGYHILLYRRCVDHAIAAFIYFRKKRSVSHQLIDDIESIFNQLTPDFPAVMDSVEKHWNDLSNTIEDVYDTIDHLDSYIGAAICVTMTLFSSIMKTFDDKIIMSKIVFVLACAIACALAVLHDIKSTVVA